MVIISFMSSTRTTILKVIGLLVLLAINVALVVVLTRPVEPPAAQPLPIYSPVAPAPPEEIKVPQPSEPLAERPSSENDETEAPVEPEPTPTGPQAQESGPAARLLTAVSADVALRAHTGSCQQPGSAEISRDGGTSWSTVESELTSFVRLRAQNLDTFFMIGANEDCETTQVGSYSAGDAWINRDSQLADSWYIDPADRHTLHGLEAAVAAPCPVVTDLVGIGTADAVILCGDGQLGWTTDGGAAWQLSGALPGAAAITSEAQGGVLLAGYGANAECLGVSIHRVDREGDSQQVSCLPLEGYGQLHPADIAISRVDETVLLWAGDAVYRSTDSGASWEHR